MHKMTLARRSLALDTRGANLVEYIILVGTVALFALAGFKIFGKSVREKVLAQAVQVDGIK